MTCAIATGMYMLMDTFETLTGVNLLFFTRDGSHCKGPFSAAPQPNFALANHSAVYMNALAGDLRVLFSVGDIRGSSKPCFWRILSELWFPIDRESKGEGAPIAMNR